MQAALIPILLGPRGTPDAFFDLASGSTPPGSTFTRGSSGWYFNSSGVLTSASSNVARFDYDPSTLAPLGYLAEMQSTNGLLQSGDLSNAAWTASGVTVTGNSVVAPDGTTTMAKLVESNTNVAHKVSQAITLATATTAGFSFFVEAKERSKFYISVQASSANYATAIFDTAGAGTTASQTSVGGTSGTIGETGIRNVGGGIYRIWMQAKVTGANPTIVLGLASLATGNTVNTTGDVTYAGDGASAGYGWGAQFDTAGVGVTSYIPTAGSTVTRSADILSLPLTSLPGWSASKGGVLVAAYRLHTVAPSGGPTNQIALGLNDGSSNNLVDLRANYLPLQRALGLMVSGGSSQGNPNGSNPALVPFARTKLALGYSTSDLYLAANGSFADARTGTFSLPVGLTTANIAPGLNGTIESIAYYAGARPDAFVQAVSR